MDEKLDPGDPVTLTWYEPGEPWYPMGWVVQHTDEDVARLRGQGIAYSDSWVLVHWQSGNWRRWEERDNLRRDHLRGPLEIKDEWRVSGGSVPDRG